MKSDNINTKNKVSEVYCDNTIVENGRDLFLEKVWRSSQTSKEKDSKGIRFPFPKVTNVVEPDIKNVINRLTKLNLFLNTKKKYHEYDQPKDCLLCDKKSISKCRYIYKQFGWEDGLVHYIKTHNIGISLQFKKFLLIDHTFLSRSIKQSNLSSQSSQSSQSNSIKQSNGKQMELTIINKDNDKYVVLDRIQLMILDALMTHGGYKKKYTDYTEDFNRYSEHAGLLDFKGTSLDKIVVSANTTKIDEDDNDIFLPSTVDEMMNYEYIFHTHPPTPKPGGRAINGILYEFPSIGDIYHFIEHHNIGNVIGSLVICIEGMYNIRKFTNDEKSIADDNKLYMVYDKACNNIQKKALKKYGTDFTNIQFYSEIAQNTKYIGQLNNILNQFEIHIDFYPRKKNKKNQWVLDTVFLNFRKNKNKRYSNINKS
jgi:hypothetical protein